MHISFFQVSTTFCYFDSHWQLRNLRAELYSRGQDARKNVSKIIYLLLLLKWLYSPMRTLASLMDITT
jgi:hypothetical protein